VDVHRDQSHVDACGQWEGLKKRFSGCHKWMTSNMEDMKEHSAFICPLIQIASCMHLAIFSNRHMKYNSILKPVSVDF